MIIHRNHIIISLVAVISIVSCFSLAGCGNSQDGFSIPSKSKIALVYSSGKGDREKSRIYFYDEQGGFLEKEQYGTMLCRNCINHNVGSDTYHLFYHERVLFDDGTVLENEEMQNQYKFASDDGLDAVYENGYIDAWGMYYKSIPHGMSYEQADLGFFDLLTIYNKEQITDLVVEPSGSICVNTEEGAIYNFLDVNTEKKIPYQTITRKNEGFKISDDEIDMSSFALLDRQTMETTVMYSVWDDQTLYLFMNIIGEDESQQTNCIVRLKKADNSIRFVDYETIDLKKLSGEKGAGMVMDGIIKDAGDTIKYYSYDSPCGIMTFNKKTEKLSFQEFHFDAADDGDEDRYVMLSEEQGDIYLLAENSEETACDIYKVLEDDTLQFIETINTNEESKLFLTDFYVF